MFFIISNALGAEELSVGGTSGAKKPVVVDADDVEYLDEEHRIIGKNHVKVNYENVVLTADGIDVAMASKDAVATGAVSLCYEDIRVQGDELHYNFESQQGYMLGKTRGSGYCFAPGIRDRNVKRRDDNDRSR
jgi:Organic solvent tolerance protein OstA